MAKHNQDGSTTVLFRAEGPKARPIVTAVFPCDPGSPGTMSCYQHIGQHSACTTGWYRTTRPATEEEYLPLLHELVDYGPRGAKPYAKLRIVSRITSDMEEVRRTAELA